MFKMGDQVGAYQLKQVIGSGNSAAVYLASLIDRPDQLFAIKLRVRGQGLHEETLAARFRESARLHLQLCHPNIAWLHESIETERYQAMVIEYLAGGTLSDYLSQRQTRLNLHEACLLGVFLCDGLEHMHDIQIIHRDIKPDNLIFANPQDLSSIRVADFDVSKNPYTSPNLTENGAHVGTLCYTAPEQFNQESPRATADVYSLGMVLFEMLTGRLPFEQITAPAIFSRFLDNTPFPSLSMFSPECSSALDWVIEKSIVIDPSDRIPSAATLAALLLAAVLDVRPGFNREIELLRLARVDWLSGYLPAAPPHVYKALVHGLEQLNIQLSNQR